MQIKKMKNANLQLKITLLDHLQRHVEWDIIIFSDDTKENPRLKLLLWNDP